LAENKNKDTHKHENTDIKEYWWGQTGSYEGITATVMEENISSQSQSTSIFIKHFLLTYILEGQLQIVRKMPHSCFFVVVNISTDNNLGKTRI